MHRVSCRMTLAATLLACWPLFLHAAPATAEVKEKAPSSAEKIKKQLDQMVTLEVTDQSLSAVLAQIREQTKINFVVDRFTIQQLGQDPESMPVSVQLKEVKARTCLRSILSPYSLGYAIIGDTVLISTNDMAMHRQMRQRVSIDLERVDLAALLKQLSKDTATNLILDTRVGAKEAKTEVSLQMEDVPLETAVRLMAEMAGLKPVKVGNVLLVTTKSVANELRNDPDLHQSNNPRTGNRLDDMGMLQQLQMQNFGPNQWGWGNFPAQGIVPNGMPFGPQGNGPIPPLEKPPEKGTEPGEGEKPAEPVKKP